MALAKASRKLSKTFFGSEADKDVWIQEVDEVLIELSYLNRTVPDWEQPKIYWEQSPDPEIEAPENLKKGFAYMHHNEQLIPFQTEDNGPPVVLELFAGAGGMSLGLEKAGFRLEDAVELDDSAAASLKINFNQTTVYDEDVNDFLALAGDNNNIGYPKRGKHNHIHSSSPCNGFSRANRAPGGGKNGKKKNDLVRAIIDAIRLFEPQTASLENVTGILDKRHIGYLKEIVATLFFELQYNVRQCVLNAADFGDPQNRERVFLLVSKKGIPLPRAPVATHGKGPGLIPYRTVRDCIGDLAEIPPAIGAGKVVVNGTEIWKHCKAGTELKSETKTLDADAPADTLYGQSTNAYVHYDQDRHLSIREMARLQSFPDSFDFPKNRNVARRLIFNAVPVGLAHAVAKAVMGSYA